MKRFVSMLFSLFLVSCAATPATTPTLIPFPTVPVKGYPAVSQDIKQVVLAEVQKPDVAFDGVLNVKVISSGDFYTANITINGQEYALDLLMVYERNTSVAAYPLVVGVLKGDTYMPSYSGYDGEGNREAYLDYLEAHDILARGRRLYPELYGDIVTENGIEWNRCGLPPLQCEVGAYMTQQYNLDEFLYQQMLGVNQPIPDGFALAWTWSAATPENTLPGFDKVVLP